ncbi:hypothetical protein K458DRAFT_390764 [Lentithecium fluviatile CBS 122367]|uniref:Uncharacterized protein n=1 Tax=Lentithecium fluviatile CBS 122367 TaxID=1168545 RepID=A0A6G1IY77_9PLEO|nr:hypothetical protein K458DRAFT_390764 [Lentithecium fluviatile CBS 122367]
MAAPDLGARVPRIPKLTYRTRLPTDDSSPTSRHPVRDPSIIDSLEIQPCVSNSTTSTTDNRPSSDSRSTTSSSSVSTSLASSNGSTTRSSKTPKKKKNGVLSFLTIKEPSQLALEQYAESQRKQTAAKGGHAAPVGLQSISLQKLPANVPKVNSKWDGIPESLKSSKSSIASPKRESSSSHGSSHSSGPPPNYDYGLNTSVFSVASDGSRGPPNSLASPMASTTNFGERRDSGPSDSSETPTLNSPSTSSLPSTTYFFPDADPSSKGALPTSYTEHPWSPPPPPPDMTLEAFPFPDANPDEPTHSVDSKADAIFKKLKANGRGFLAGEAREIKLGDESDDSDSVPDSHDFLFDLQPSSIGAAAPVQAPQAMSAPHAVEPPPRGLSPVSPTMTDFPSRGPSTNFSRPRPRPSPFALPPKSGPSSLPTLYEASIASTDTITDPPNLSKRSSKNSDETFIAPPTPTTPTSQRNRSNSSRDRLGLGGHIRKNEVLPWESQEQPAHAPLGPHIGDDRNALWNFAHD